MRTIEFELMVNVKPDRTLTTMADMSTHFTFYLNFQVSYEHFMLFQFSDINWGQHNDGFNDKD